MTRVRRWILVFQNVGLLGLPLVVGCVTAAKPPEKRVPESREEFSGIVRDSLTPVPDVAVALYKGPSLLARAVTDKSGRFSFGSPPNGDYTFSIAAASYAACRVDVSFLPPQNAVLIGVVPAADSARLRRQRAASGNTCSCRNRYNRAQAQTAPPFGAAVQSPNSLSATLAVDVGDPDDGAGVGQADVILLPDSASGGTRLLARTDNTGRATFANIRPGKYRVRARRIGFAPNEADILAAAGKVDILTLPLKWDQMALCVIVRTGR